MHEHTNPWTMSVHVRVNHVSYSSCVTFCCLLHYLLTAMIPYISEPEVPLRSHVHTQQVFVYHGLAVPTKLSTGSQGGACYLVNVLTRCSQPRFCPAPSDLYWVCLYTLHMHPFFLSPFPHCPLEHLCISLLIFTAGPCRDRPRESLLTAPTDLWSLHHETELTRTSKDIQCKKSFSLSVL